MEQPDLRRLDQQTRHQQPCEELAECARQVQGVADNAATLAQSIVRLLLCVDDQRHKQILQQVAGQGEVPYQCTLCYFHCIVHAARVLLTICGTLLEHDLRLGDKMDDN